MALTLDELTVLLPDASILLGASLATRDEAIRAAGNLLVDAGAVEPDYIEQMLERERVVSTFVGDGVAMPHGTLTAKNDVRAEGLCLIVLTEPVSWAGQSVTLVIGIAAHGRRYITLLSQLAATLLDDDRAAALRAAPTPGEARQLLAG
jgi:PTS system mannitol-specific IIA component